MTDHINPSEDIDEGMNGLWDWAKKQANKAYSGMTAAPRFIHAAATKDLDNFKLFDDQSLAESFKEQIGGNTVVLSLLSNQQAGGTPVPPINNLSSKPEVQNQVKQPAILPNNLSSILKNG